MPPPPATGGYAVASVLLGGMLFGTAGIAQAYAPEGTHPVAVGAVRLAVGALVLTLVVLVRRAPAGRVTASRRGARGGPGAGPAGAGGWSGIVAVARSRAGLLAAAGAAAYQPFFFAGIGLAGVPLGTLVAVGSAPVFTGLLGWWLRGERPSRGWITATAICLAGLALVTGAGASAGSLAGLALTAGAGLSIAAYTVAAKTLLARGRDTLEVTAAAFLVGGLAVLPAAAWLGLGWLASAPGLLVGGYLGIATMGVANVLYARGLGRLPSGTTATLGLADPLTATALGALVLGQRLTGLGVAGLVLLSVGLVLQAGWAGRQRRARPGPLAH